MKIEETPWSLAEGKMENGNPFLLRFREFYPTEEEQFKYCFLIEVIWRYTDSGGGMPDINIHSKMQKFETLIDDELGKEEISILMTCITGNNKRIWHFYTYNSDLFMEKLNKVLQGKEKLPIEIELFQDDEWNAYKEFVDGVIE